MDLIVNIAAYKFITLDDLDRRRGELLVLGERLLLKGTILLGNEGINLFLAGSRCAMDEFLSNLHRQPELVDLEVKESFSDRQPFDRLFVKIKKEIIAFGVDGIDPRRETSPRISARQLKQWLDEGTPVVLLDVRNDFEYQVGSFEGAIPIGIDHFRDFPEVVEKLPDDFKDKPVVTFCTGGIRCEKAGPLLEQSGFTDVYQLDGGILKYFEECGGEHYRGECFVFDQRVALDAELHESNRHDISV